MITTKALSKARNLVIFACAFLGISIGAWSRWEFSNIRWTPLYEQLLPRPNDVGKFAFWSDSGIFELTIKLPMSATEMSQIGGLDEKAPIPCRLSLRLRSGGHVVTNIEMSSIHWTGIIGYTHMDCFNGAVINIPTLGKYALELTRADSEFNYPMAKFSLERQQNAESAAYFSVIADAFSYTLIGISVVTVIFSWIWHLKSRKRLPDNI